MLWAITCHFNPCRYRSRVENFRRFRAHLPVPLLAVELIFDGADEDAFELGLPDADRLLQLRGGDVLWQKERLLNIALGELPPSCSAVAWLDADVLLHNGAWVEQTERCLQDHAFCQPFSTASDLPRGAPIEGAAELPAHRESVAWRLARNAVPPGYFIRGGTSQRHGIAPGKAWAGRRDVLDRHGFYDRAVIGSGDKLLLSAMAGEYEGAILAYGLNQAQAAHFRAWAGPFHRDVAGRIGVVPGRLTHLWHGELAHRGYDDRHREFAQFAFDPARDVRSDASGALAWSSERPAMHAWVRRFFQRRREDGADAGDRQRRSVDGGVVDSRDQP